MSNSIIQVEDLTMAYHDRPVIWDIDVDIVKNSRTVIIGPNGAGKSTLLKGMLGLLKPLSGEVRFEGKPYKEVYKEVAYIPQQGSVNWDFPTTVIDVVLMGLYVHLGWIRRPKKSDREIAMMALERIGMQDFADRQISRLSGGQKQRVFLARAIAQNANIYFMDEPLAGVDFKTETVIMDTIKEFQANGKTVLVVHHDLHTVEEYFDHIIIINKKIIAQGTIKDTFNDENIKKAYTNRLGII